MDNKFETLTKRNIEALKNKDKDSRRVYSYLINLIQKEVKENNSETITNNHVEKATKKMIKVLDQQNTEQAIKDKQLILNFLPKEMDQIELQKIVLSLKKEGKSLKEVMQHLSQYPTANKGLAKNIYNND